MEKKKKPIFIGKHFSAVLFRRWTMVKRSWKTVVLSSIATLVFSALAIICQYLMVSLMKEDTTPVTFNSNKLLTNEFVWVDNFENTDTDAATFAETSKELLTNVFQTDTGRDPYYYNFTSLETANKDMYDMVDDKEKSGVTYINMGISVNPSESATIDLGGIPIPYIKQDITLMYNSSASNGLLHSQIALYRVFWKYIMGSDTDFEVASVRLFRKIMEMAFGSLGPMLICVGLCSIVPLLIAQPIIDINGEVRPFMISCTLTILPYWLASFIVDFIIWVITVTLVWVVFIAAQIAAFQDNLLTTWYGLVMAGPSFILFIYCLSFMFGSPDSASRQSFLILVILLLIPMIIDIVRNMEANPLWLNIIYSFFPHINLQRILGSVLSNIGAMSLTLGDYFEDDQCQVYLIMEFGNIVLYGFILFIIEFLRDWIHKKGAKRDFGNFTEFFKDAKSKHPVTDEAHKMEALVADSENDSRWAVKIDNVSRLFFNTAGEPIPAVNCVSLGVEKGSLFGFLGANGAGKTTLIRMITSLLPPSDGTISINGVDIDVYNDPTLLSICPQFNTHLCDEMTPAEHFKLYAMLFQLDDETAKERSDNLIKLLELEDIKDEPIRELSAGDVRKLAIALCFLGPAEIILLDEPTASLDPVARHHVHEMISEFKGQKTFMLCTHLLSEAEALCDTISIMIKGNVYTVGSPQELSGKFGTEFKIDVGLKDESEKISQMADRWFAKNLPSSELSIMRPKARIYSIPAKDITLPDLFEKMQEGKDGDSGIAYYTCSSSSLERVFMEIVHMSESEDIVVVGGQRRKSRRSSVIHASEVPLVEPGENDSNLPSSRIDDNDEFVVP